MANNIYNTIRVEGDHQRLQTTFNPNQSLCTFFEVPADANREWYFDNIGTRTDYKFEEVYFYDRGVLEIRVTTRVEAPLLWLQKMRDKYPHFLFHCLSVEEGCEKYCYVDTNGRIFGDEDYTYKELEFLFDSLTGAY